MNFFNLDAALKRVAIFVLITLLSLPVAAFSHRDSLALTPPMGWMSWNLLMRDVNEQVLREMADAMVESGLRDAGYEYIYIDDAWQGGRDNRNNIIPDPKKFPSGIKALADYVHARGLKLGIYSDAAQLTCDGFTASYGFEQQDARTFAEWGIDYLKYDYCNAPTDVETAKKRYSAMAKALENCGRNIVFGVCEWGERKPWLWAHEAGGQLWRTTTDVRDAWTNDKCHGGILDILQQNAKLYPYAGPGRWNDMDMLVVGLYGKGIPSSDYGSKGCTDVEYETQMSMWCMLSSPLALSNDLRHMNEETRRILMNKEIIAINQDPLGKVAVPKVMNDKYQVYVRELSGNRHAIAIINISDAPIKVTVGLKEVGLEGGRAFYDVWQHRTICKGKRWKGALKPHQTKVYVLK